MKLHFLKRLREKYEHSAIKSMDIVIVLLIFMLGSVMLIYNLMMLSRIEPSAKLVVVVSRNLKEIHRFDLKENRIVDIEDYGKLSIKSGKVKVLAASCRDKICVHTNEIKHEGEAIICLPNKIIIEIRREE